MEVVYAPIDAPKTYYQDLLKQYQPAACIAIERCGENVQGDYANMRGVSIAEHTARIDELFELAKEQHIPTFGVGDGGNEIGMGNLKEVISEKLSLVPCRTCVDHLIHCYSIQLGSLRPDSLPGSKDREKGISVLSGSGQVSGEHRCPWQCGRCKKRTYLYRRRFLPQRLKRKL